MALNQCEFAVMRVLFSNSRISRNEIYQLQTVPDAIIIYKREH